MAQSAFFISDIVFGVDGYASLTNGSDEAADPAGLILCQFPAYPEVPSGSVAPGQSVQVPASDLGGLTNDSGEMALYLRPDYSDPDAIVGYVQWGAPDHKRSEPAIAAGLWQSGSCVDASGAAGLTAAGPATVAVAGWSTTPSD